MKKLAFLVVTAALIGACGDDDPAGGTDAGTGTDSGSMTDSGHVHETDSGVTTDSGTPTDSGPLTDGGGDVDAGPINTLESFAGCTGMYTAPGSGGPTITFGVGGFVYSPKCLEIPAGTMVTFEGAFSSHPLRGASTNVAPTITNTDSGTSASFTFTTPGVYGYYCNFHGSSSGSGMSGAIKVVPAT